MIISKYQKGYQESQAFDSVAMSGGVWYFDISWYYQTIMIISKYQKYYQNSQAFDNLTMSGGVWYFEISWYYQTVMINSKYQKDYQEPQVFWFRFINKARKWKTDTKLINTSFVEQNIYCLKKLSNAIWCC